MLKKVNRLKKRYQFNYVYRAGSHVSGEAIVLYFTPSKTKNIKVGFAVSKKIGHATKRNLVKRRLREIVYSMIPHLKQHFNIIVVARDSVMNFRFDEIKSEFQKLVIKAELEK